MQGRRADLLFALDQDAHVARAARRSWSSQADDRVRVRDAARLVVGAAAPVETAAALGRLERVALPVLDDARRLHVVVRIEKDSGRAGARVHPLADHVRDASRRRRRAGPISRPCARRSVGGRLGARAHVVAAIGVGADARDAHELLELGPRLVAARRRPRRPRRRRAVIAWPRSVLGPAVAERRVARLDRALHALRSAASACTPSTIVGAGRAPGARWSRAGRCACPAPPSRGAPCAC